MASSWKEANIPISESDLCECTLQFSLLLVTLMCRADTKTNLKEVQREMTESWAKDIATSHFILPDLSMFSVKRQGNSDFNTQVWWLEKACDFVSDLSPSTISLLSISWDKQLCSASGNKPEKWNWHSES